MRYNQLALWARWIYRAFAPCFFTVATLFSTTARSQSAWDEIPVIEHRQYQAIDDSGNSAYPPDGAPFRLRGVVLNDSEDWLAANESYSESIGDLGGQAEIFVQAVNLDGTPWDRDPTTPDEDFGGTSIWMGQNYGNLPFIGDAGFSYVDQDMASAGDGRPAWYDELDRLGLYRPGSPVAEDQLVRAGDLVEVRARVNGLNFQGKHNVNERHDNAPANDFEIVRLSRGFGLPDPPQLELSDLKDVANQDLFDATRATSGEHYQGAWVEIQDVRLQDPSQFGSDRDVVLIDDTGRTLGAYLGLNPHFDDAGIQDLIGGDGTFNVRGILDQKSPTNVGGYRLLVMHADDLFGSSTALQPGDANQDLTFDQFDLIEVQQAGKYLSAAAATWGEGDWDGAPGGRPGHPPAGDGRFDQKDIVAALEAGVYRTGPYGAAALTAEQAWAQVPEPTSALLAVVASIGALLMGLRPAARDDLGDGAVV